MKNKSQTVAEVHREEAQHHLDMAELVEAREEWMYEKATELGVDQTEEFEEAHEEEFQQYWNTKVESKS